ncbi:MULTISPECIES: tRNA dihydrouridine(20/20a) synthase DusA [Halomonadaceae]|uniref:tRNA-dihydrouridine(20/20a) synthase n=1 Tax=Vreelandella halophila TaxID=86177 RepID=A0A9X5B5X0_9GAMM|nr:MULTISPECIES: tRNA dihydrouridine(20/20a) synthase DusA [Halomonas]MYL26953.1 tRNA dihydrouridine(20/20a) synthase DusA [Halomonas utahensis]MYL74214.1 tRNA dihydrouridine(20/20a) synthase DusA [Halomonas sp. 22501_18_FS]
MQRPEPDRRFSIAPMMDHTTRDYRWFVRGLTRHALLYTEMVTTGALIHGDRARFLDYDAEEHPVALQLGGADPAELAQCAAMAEAWGYDEVNLNVGCPSDRVQNNRIGACLMAEPDTVARAVAAMKASTALPVTVKHRIGIDGHEQWEDLVHFIERVAEAGCRTFIVHARIAILQGLSPKENREVPPLKYDWVHALRKRFPQLEIIINGGFWQMDAIREQLRHVDGVMIGRAAYQQPWLLSRVDPEIHGTPEPCITRTEAIERFIPYLERRLAEGVPLQAMSRHIMNLFHGCAGGRQFRRHLSENAHRAGAGTGVVRDALALVQEKADAA